MPQIPETVTKEQYLLKSTFFYGKLKSGGYFELFRKVRKYVRVEGENLDWAEKKTWGISSDAWDVLLTSNIMPAMVFVHPKVLAINPTFLKYYRSVAMLPQKGLKALAHVSGVEAIENGKGNGDTIDRSVTIRLAKAINEVTSLVVQMAMCINERQIEGMMYATAGTNIDGSWRNQIGAEGERVIKKIIINGLLAHDEITSLIDKANDTFEIESDGAALLLSDMDGIKTVNVANGHSVLFSSEPDVTIYNAQGDIVGVIEIKSGLDPAGALERLGAMFKSFENTLAEFPDAVTILVASCITEEVDNRLNASMVVRQKYLTTTITSNDSEKRKFVNRLRVIMKLAKSSL